MLGLGLELAALGDGVFEINEMVSLWSVVPRLVGLAWTAGATHRLG